MFGFFGSCETLCQVSLLLCAPTSSVSVPVVTGPAELHLLSAHEASSHSRISQQPLWLTAEPLCCACWFLTCVHHFGETSVESLAWFKLLVFALLVCEGYLCVFMHSGCKSL